MSQLSHKGWRPGVVLILTLGLLAPGGGLAQPEPAVYSYQLDYEGTCSGAPSNGEFHVSGSQLTLYVQGPDGLQPIGSAPLAPDGTFTIAVGDQDFGITMTGRIAENAVTGTGSVRTFGSPGGCNVRLSGTRRGTSTAPTDGAATPPTSGLEEEEFDPTSTEQLSDGEFRGILRRTGLSQDEIDRAFADVDRAVASRPEYGEQARAVLRYTELLGRLARIYDDDLNPAFARLAAFSQRGGPVAVLSHSLLGGSSAAESAFNRLVRLCINEDL